MFFISSMKVELRIPWVTASHMFPSVADHELVVDCVTLLVVSLLPSGILTTSMIVSVVAFVFSGTVVLDSVLTLMVPLLTTTLETTQGILRVKTTFNN